jgi:hypothetical protein
MGSLVWDALARPSTVVELQAAVRGALARPDAVDPERLRADVTAFVAELERLGLVDVQPD